MGKASRAKKEARENQHYAALSDAKIAEGTSAGTIAPSVTAEAGNPPSIDLAEATRLGHVLRETPALILIPGSKRDAVWTLRKHKVGLEQIAKAVSQTITQLGAAKYVTLSRDYEIGPENVSTINSREPDIRNSSVVPILVSLFPGVPAVRMNTVVATSLDEADSLCESSGGQPLDAGKLQVAAKAAFHL